MRILIFLLVSSIAIAQQPQRTRPMQSPPQVGTTASTGPHVAVLNWSNSSCTTNSLCSLQAYRAQCTSASSCPTYTAGSSAWKTLDMSVNLVPQPGPNGTSWQYQDKDTALMDSTTYAWVATNSYVGAATSSPASTNYVGSTNNGTPPAPVLSSNGNSVN